MTTTTMSTSLSGQPDKNGRFSLSNELEEKGMIDRCKKISEPNAVITSLKCTSSWECITDDDTVIRKRMECIDVFNKSKINYELSQALVSLECHKDLNKTISVLCNIFWPIHLCVDRYFPDRPDASPTTESKDGRKPLDYYRAFYRVFILMAGNKYNEKYFAKTQLGMAINNSVRCYVQYKQRNMRRRLRAEELKKSSPNLNRPPPPQQQQSKINGADDSKSLKKEKFDMLFNLSPSAKSTPSKLKPSPSSPVVSPPKRTSSSTITPVTTASRQRAFKSGSGKKMIPIPDKKVEMSKKTNNNKKPMVMTVSEAQKEITKLRKQMRALKRKEKERKRQEGEQADTTSRANKRFTFKDRLVAMGITTDDVGTDLSHLPPRIETDDMDLKNRQGVSFNPFSGQDNYDSMMVIGNDFTQPPNPMVGMNGFSASPTSLSLLPTVPQTLPSSRTLHQHHQQQQVQAQISTFASKHPDIAFYSPKKKAITSSEGVGSIRHHHHQSVVYESTLMEGEVQDFQKRMEDLLMEEIPEMVEPDSDEDETWVNAGVEERTYSLEVFHDNQYLNDMLQEIMLRVDSSRRLDKAVENMARVFWFPYQLVNTRSLKLPYRSKFDSLFQYVLGFQSPTQFKMSRYYHTLEKTLEYLCSSSD